MYSRLKILHLEDLPSDAELVSHELKKGGIVFESCVVDNKKDYTKALQDFAPNLVLSDHSLPMFDSREALYLLKTSGLKIPFVLVTATISEEYAVEIMKDGAYDYVLKDRLQRLPQAIRNAMERWQTEVDKQKYLEEIISKEALLREAEHMARFGSWQTDYEKGSSKWSDESYRILGYAPGEVQPSFENLLKSIHPEDHDYVKNTLEKAIRDLNSHKLNFRIIDRNGIVKYIRSEIMIARNKDKKTIRITGFNQDVTEMKLAENARTKAEGEILEMNKQLRELSSHLQNVREEERKHIAREIHDELGQQLTGIKMDLAMMKQDSISEKKINDQSISEIMNMVDDAIKTVRKISSELRPSVIDDLGLLAALNWQSHEFEKRYGIPCSFTSSVKEYPFEKGFVTGVFRIYQESLTNIARHANATEISSSLSEEDDHLNLSIKDNGVGFNQETIRKKSLGIIGMKERAIMFGGEFSIDSKEGQGTRITVRLPIHLKK